VDSGAAPGLPAVAARSSQPSVLTPRQRPPNQLPRGPPTIRRPGQADACWWPCSDRRFLCPKRSPPRAGRHSRRSGRENSREPAPPPAPVRHPPPTAPRELQSREDERPPCACAGHLARVARRHLDAGTPKECCTRGRTRTGESQSPRGSLLETADERFAANRRRVGHRPRDERFGRGASATFRELQGVAFRAIRDSSGGHLRCPNRAKAGPRPRFEAVLSLERTAKPQTGRCRYGLRGLSPGVGRASIPAHRADRVPGGWCG